MANALGTLATGLIIQRSLDLVFTQRPMLNSVSLDLSDQACAFNQAITTRTFAVPSVNNFGTGAVDRADTDVSVTLNLFKEVHHAFTPQEISGTARNLVDESAMPIAVAIANHLVDAIAAKWLIAQFTNATTVASGWTYANTLLPVRNALVGRGVPQGMPKFFAVSSAVYGAFLADTTIVAALNNPANAEAIRTGLVPQVSGMEISEYPAIPSTGTMVGFAGTKDSVVICARVPRDPRELLPNAPFPGVLGVVTHARTGLSVMVNEWIDPATLKANVRVIFMYGVAVGNTNNGQILKTT